MRTQKYFFAIITAAICFASCSEDGIIQSEIKPDKQVLQRDLDVEQTLEFTSWQDLVIAAPECPVTIGPVGTTHSDDSPKGDLGCMGTYGFTGKGQGYVEGLDRFFVESQMTYNPQTHAFTGLISFDFASTASTLQLRIEGPAEGRHDTDQGMTDVHCPCVNSAR